MKKILLTLILMSFVGNVFSAVGETHYVKPLQAKIFSEPSKDSEVKFIIAIGRKMIEFDRKNGFIAVWIDKSGGRDGWIEEANVSPTDADGMTY